MAEAVADFFWKRLAEWGVKKIFGYPGDGINGLLGALQRMDSAQDPDRYRALQQQMVDIETERRRVRGD